MSYIKFKLSAAPRLRAYLVATENALIMYRKDWERLKVMEGKPVEIDISMTPLAAVLKNHQVVGSFTQRISKQHARILIFREDPKDKPLDINLDRYRVFEDFRSRPDYSRLITSSTTADDQAMQDFHSKYDIITKEKERRGHYLRDLPGIYKALLLKKTRQETS
jgi:hypothetical protein